MKNIFQKRYNFEIMAADVKLFCYSEQNYKYAVFNNYKMLFCHT